MENEKKKKERRQKRRQMNKKEGEYLVTGIIKNIENSDLLFARHECQMKSRTSVAGEGDGGDRRE